MRTLDGKQFRNRIDLVCGGFPCQPFSNAGKRRGKDDDRFLWPEMLRIINETNAHWVIGENVNGFISMGFDQAVSDLETSGYEVEAFVIPAVAVGAEHRRDRIWIVANSEGKRIGRETGNILETHGGQNGKMPQQSNSSSASIVANPNGAGLSLMYETGNRRPTSDGINARGELVRAYTANGQEQWKVEPYLGRRFDGLSSWMDGLDMMQSHKLLLAYAHEKKERPEEILSALRNGIDSSGVWKSFGRQGRVSSQEVLLAYLCKLEENHLNNAWLQLEGAETLENELRILRPQQEPPRASHRPGYKKQHPFQHPNTLQALSQLLAYHAEKAWVDYCRENAIPYGWEEGINKVADGIPNRMDRLKALGNAIIPQIATQIGLAIMQLEQPK